MGIRHEKQQVPDDTADQDASNELVKLIRKLRWMGMEEEAEKTQALLARRRVRPADSVFATPPDTD
jgi:hypothetical protein